MSSRTRLGILAAVGTEVLYGGSFVFTKGITNTIDPFALLAWRFGVALVILLILAATRVIRLTIRPATLRPLLVLAAFQPAIYYTAETFGVMRTTASESGLIIAAIPVASMLMAVLLLGSRPAGRQVMGISVTVAGVVLTVVAGGLNTGLDLLGYGLLLIAVFAYAVYAAFAERYTSASDIDKTFVMVACGAVLFGVVALARHGAAGTLGTLVMLPVVRPDFAFAVGFLALGPTIGAFFLQNAAIARIGSTRFATFIGLSSLVALATGTLVLGERLTAVQWLGGAAILAGVYLANRGGQGTRPARRNLSHALPADDPATAAAQH